MTCTDTVMVLDRRLSVDEEWYMANDEYPVASHVAGSSAYLLIQLDPERRLDCCEASDYLRGVQV
jgi:hypothetical protein